MVWVPGCEIHNIPPGPNDPRIIPRIFVLHVEEGTNAGSERRFKATGIEAHFGVPKIGKTWQWRNTDFQADAQGDGNGYCISFETEGFATEPLNRNQIDEIIRVGRYLQNHYKIPAVMVERKTDKGWGYHRQFDSWNPNNHSCPGNIRLAQLKTVLLPALADDSERDDMTVEELDNYFASERGQRRIETAVTTVLRTATDPGPTGNRPASVWFDTVARQVKETHDAVTS